jgi:hypothetical protein
MRNIQTVLFAAALGAALNTAAIARADDATEALPKHAISIVIASGNKMLGAPRVIVLDGKKASIEVGQKHEPGISPTSIKTQSVKLSLTPTTGDDDKVQVKMEIQVTDEISGDTPSRTTRETRTTLALARGKQASVSVPEGSLGAPLDIRLQIDAAK